MRTCFLQLQSELAGMWLRCDTVNRTWADCTRGMCFLSRLVTCVGTAHAGCDVLPCVAVEFCFTELSFKRREERWRGTIVRKAMFSESDGWSWQRVCDQDFLARVCSAPRMKPGGYRAHPSSSSVRALPKQSSDSVPIAPHGLP